MRTMIRVSVPVEAGNKAFDDGSLQKTIVEALERLRPEAAYFLADHGIRTAMFVMDFKDTSDMPSVAEPFFHKLGANVEFIPVMNADDLKAGLGKIAR